MDQFEHWAECVDFEFEYKISRLNTQVSDKKY